MARRLKKTNKPTTLTRVVKFQIHPSAEQLETLQKVSDNLRLIWNEKLRERMRFWNEELKPLYQQLKKVSGAEGKPLRAEIKATFGRAPVNYVPGQPERSQRYWLTQMRKSLGDFASVPCAWQQEMLVILEGAFDSFMKLRKNGDRTARPPREKTEHSFCEIQGLTGWKLVAGGVNIAPQKDVSQLQSQALMQSSEASIVLSPGKHLYDGPELSFPFPNYQQMVLAQTVKLSKFTLYRDKKKRFWISIAYAIPKPERVEVEEGKKVFLSLGASCIGVSAPDRSFEIGLWRSDKHWMPKIEMVKARLKQCTKGSRAWRRRVNAINVMYEKMRLQMLQNHREVIARRLKACGVHFVIVAHSPIRGKEGALADSSKPERGGVLGLNWSVQNTGSLAQLRQLLEQKTAEWGGSVEVIELRDRFATGSGYFLPKAHRATRLRTQQMAG